MTCVVCVCVCVGIEATSSCQGENCRHDSSQASSQSGEGGASPDGASQGRGEVVWGEDGATHKGTDQCIRSEAVATATGAIYQQ